MYIFIVRCNRNEDCVCAYKTLRGAWKCAIEILKDYDNEYPKYTQINAYDKEDCEKFYKNMSDRVGSDYIYLHSDDIISVQRVKLGN